MSYDDYGPEPGYEPGRDPEQGRGGDEGGRGRRRRGPDPYEARSADDGPAPRGEAAQGDAGGAYDRQPVPFDPQFDPQWEQSGLGWEQAAWIESGRGEVLPPPRGHIMPPPVDPYTSRARQGGGGSEDGYRDPYPGGGEPYAGNGATQQWSGPVPDALPERRPRDGYGRDNFSRDDRDQDDFSRDDFSRDDFSRDDFNRDDSRRDDLGRDDFSRNGRDQERYGREGFNGNGFGDRREADDGYGDSAAERDSRLDGASEASGQRAASATTNKTVFGAAGLAVVTAIAAVAAAPVLALVSAFIQVGIAVGWMRTAGLANSRRTLILIAAIGVAATGLAYHVPPDEAPGALASALGVGFVLMACDQLIRRSGQGLDLRSESLAGSVTGAAFAVLPAGFVVARAQNSGITAACALAAAAAVLCSALLGQRRPAVGVGAGVLGGALLGGLTSVSLGAHGGLPGGAAGGLATAVLALVGVAVVRRLEDEEGRDVRLSAQTLPLAFAAIGAAAAAVALH